MPFPFNGGLAKLERRSIMRSNKGFTLIEILVAFVVLIIVSVSLMQAFAVSARLNRRAYDTDKATALATKIQEVFRRDSSRFRGGSVAYLEANVEEMAGCTSALSSGGTENCITQYLNKNWLPAASESERSYEVRAVIAYSSSGTAENSYYPDYYARWDLDSSDTSAPAYDSDGNIIPLYCDLTVEENGANPTLTLIKRGAAGSLHYALNASYTSGGDLVLVIGNNGRVINTKLIVTVYNNTTTYNDCLSSPPVGIALYLLDAPDGNCVYNSKKGENETAVTFVSAEGYTKTSILASRDDDYLTDTMTITITRLSDGAVLADSKATGYYKYSETSGAS